MFAFNFQMASSGSSSSSSADAISSAHVNRDIKAPLWDHVTILDKGTSNGGNIRWRCKYCPLERTTSYTRVEAHLLQISNKGIALCKKVGIDLLAQMKREVAAAKELEERSKQKIVS